MSPVFSPHNLSFCYRRLRSLKSRALGSAQSLMTSTTNLSATTPRAHALCGGSFCYSTSNDRYTLSGSISCVSCAARSTNASLVKPQLSASTLLCSLESIHSPKWVMTGCKDALPVNQANRRWVSSLNRRSQQPSRSFAKQLRACGSDLKKIVALLKEVVDTAQERSLEAKKSQDDSTTAKSRASREGFNMSSQAALTAAMLALSRPPHRDPQGAAHLFDTLLAHGLTPDTVCCNVALNAMKQSKQAQRALELYRTMSHDESESSKWGLKSFAKPDTVSLNTTISACAAAGLWRDALAVLADALESNSRNDPSNSDDNGSLDSNRRSKSSRGSPVKKDCVMPDLVSFNAAIAACGQAGAWTEACHLLRVDMPRAAVLPDVVTFNAAMHACCKAGEWHQALALLEELQAAADVTERSAVANAASVEVLGQSLSRHPNERGHISSGNGCFSHGSSGSKSKSSNSSLKSSSISRLAMTEVTYALALEACAQGGCWQRAHILLDSARNLFESSNSSRGFTGELATTSTKSPLMTFQGYTACLRNAIEACARGGQPTKVLELAAELEAVTPRATVSLPLAITHRKISSLGAMGDADGVVVELNRCALATEQYKEQGLQHQKFPPQQDATNSKLSVNTVNVALRALAHLGDLKQLKREAARELKLRRPHALCKIEFRTAHGNKGALSNNMKSMDKNMIDWYDDDIDEKIQKEKEEGNHHKNSQSRLPTADNSSEVDAIPSPLPLTPETEGWRLALILLESMGGQTGVWGGLDGITGSIDPQPGAGEFGHSQMLPIASWPAERELPHLKHVLPNAASHEAVVLGCCAVDRWREAAALLQSMVEDSQHMMAAQSSNSTFKTNGARGSSQRQMLQINTLRPTERSVASVVEACERAGEREFAAKWLDEMSNSDTENALVAFGGTIMATAEGGQWHEAMEMLGNMEKDIAANNVNLFNAAMRACASAGHADRALALLGSIEQQGILPELRTVELCLKAVAKSGDGARASSALEVLGNMERAWGTPPTETCYHAVINALGQQGAWEHALEVFERMGSMANDESRKTLAHALRSSGKADCVPHACLSC